MGASIELVQVIKVPLFTVLANWLGPHTLLLNILPITPGPAVVRNRISSHLLILLTDLLNLPVNVACIHL